MVQVSRDSFSRADIVREVVKTRMGCQWCGGQRAKGGLFQYSVWHDSGRVARIPGEFCGIGCMRSYHLIEHRQSARLPKREACAAGNWDLVGFEGCGFGS